jgi:CheY-like chemotaxis protein
MSIYILLAGENKKNLAFVRQATDNVDCHLVLASTMSLALFLAQKNKPKLIISDVSLADGDGGRLVQEIKSDKELKDIPFIFLLEKEPEAALKKTLLNYGAARVISQSDNSNELVQLINTFIDN